MNPKDALAAPLLLCLLAWLASVPNARALDPARSIIQYRQSIWYVEDGLPSNSVFAIAQTPDRYLWLGTQEGLVRFDGVRFTPIFANDSDRSRRDRITALAVGAGGILWCGTYGGGLLRYEDGRFQRLTARDGLPSDRLQCLYAGDGGGVWAGTDHGLARVSGGTVTAYRRADGLTSDDITSISPAAAGGLWIATAGGGVCSYKDNVFTPLRHQSEAAAESVLCVYEDRVGGLWIGTSGQGLQLYLGGQLTTYTSRDGLPHDVVSAVYEDRDRNLWVGTHRGFARYRHGVFESWGDPADAPANAVVMGFCEDNEGSLWVGSQAGGLTQLVDGAVTAIGRAEGLSHDVATAILEDSHGATWIGTMGGGLNRIESGKASVYTIRQGLRSDSILSLYEDPDGSLWVGTRGGGLSHIDEGVITTMTRDDGLPSDTVLVVCGTPDGDLWVGSHGGQLSRYHDGRFTTVHLPTTEFVWALHYQQRTRTLWVGTSGGGLFEVQDGDITARLTEENGLANDLIYCLLEDSSGAIWAGTNAGISRITGRAIASVTKAQGLYSDGIYRIIEDNRGDFWMSCSQGIFRVRAGELEAVMSGKASALTSVSYGRDDGMRISECKGGTQPAGWLCRDGRIWFPTIRGVAVLDPRKVDARSTIPLVHVEQLLADEEDVPLSGDAVVPAGRRSYEIRFAAPSFDSPRKIKFRYILEGVDPDWIDADTRRSAYYANLPPGDHRFRVIACSSEGRWNTTGATITFRIRPHFYESFWFYALAAGGVGAMARWLYSVRTGRLRARAAVLEERYRLARELHDTLAQELSGMAWQLDAAAGLPEDASGKMRDSLRLAHTRTRQMIEEIRRLVWELRESKDETADLPALLRKIAKQRLDETESAVHITTRGSARPLPLGVASELARIAQEAYTNAVRHSSARNIWMSIDFASDRLTLSVKDDGKGFDPRNVTAQERRGFGLIGMSERAGWLGASLSIRSLPGEGTVVEVEVPIRRARRRGFRWRWLRGDARGQAAGEGRVTDGGGDR